MNLEAFIIGAIIGWGLYIILRGMASASHERHIAARQSAARRWAAVCQDGKLAERAREQIHAVSDAWHIYSEGRATKLFVHPGDDRRLEDRMRLMPPALSRKQNAADDLVRAIQASVAAKIVMDADGMSGRAETEYIESLDVLAQAFAAMIWAAE